MEGALSELIAELRRKGGLTLEHLGELAGVHRTSIGLIERSERGLTIGMAAQLAKALQIELSDLIHRAEDALEERSPRGAKGGAFFHEAALRQFTGLDHAQIGAAIASCYETVDAIDEQLTRRRKARIAGLVELANLSSLLSNLVGAGIAEASRGMYKRNLPHTYPDLNHVQLGKRCFRGRSAAPGGVRAARGTFSTASRPVLARLASRCENTTSRAGRGLDADQLDSAAVEHRRHFQLAAKPFHVAAQRGDEVVVAPFDLREFRLRHLRLHGGRRLRLPGGLAERAKVHLRDLIANLLIDLLERVSRQALALEIAPAMNGHFKPPVAVNQCEGSCNTLSLAGSDPGERLSRSRVVRRTSVSIEVVAEDLICLRHDPIVEAIVAGLVCGDQKHGLSLWVKRVEDPNRPSP